MTSPLRSSSEPETITDAFAMTAHRLAETTSRWIARLVGDTHAPIGGRAARTERVSPVDVNDVVDECVDLVTRSAQRIVNNGAIVLGSSRWWLHHRTTDDTLLRYWGPIQDAVRAGIDAWADRALDGARFDVSLDGPVDDPTLSVGQVEWLDNVQHAARASRVAEHQAKAGSHARTNGARLELLRGRGPGSIAFAADGSTVVGRDVALGSAAVTQESASRQHVEIASGTKPPTIRDLGSANGTLVNGREIHAPFDRETRSRPVGACHPLVDGDVIHLGANADDSVAYVFRTGTPEPAGPGPTALQRTLHYAEIHGDNDNGTHQ